MDKKIILYSTGCPQCKVLEAKLKEKNIEYTPVASVEIMLQKGITHVPVIEVEDSLLSFKEALRWVNERGEHGDN